MRRAGPRPAATIAVVFLRRHVPVASVVAATAGARAYHQRWGNPQDPFGEKQGWDHTLTYGAWEDVDTGKLNDVLKTPEVRKTHFGPEWARTRTLTQAAFNKMNEQGRGGVAGDAEHSDEQRADDDTKAAAAAAQAVAAPAVDPADEFAAFSEELRAREAVAAGVSAGGDGSEAAAFEDPALALGPPVCSVPPSLRPDAEGSAALQADDGSGDDCAVTGDGAAPMEAEAAVPDGDPLDWSTDAVVAWIRLWNPSSMDPAMEDAFRMVRVDGAMLLNSVQPADMFKEMRKWHRNRAGYTPAVTDELVQTTVYLCFPYCK